MPMPAKLRDKVRGWGPHSGIVLIMHSGRVVDTIMVLRASHDTAYALRGAEWDYDDLWFKAVPLHQAREAEAEFRHRYGLERRITKN